MEQAWEEDKDRRTPDFAETTAQMATRGPRSLWLHAPLATQIHASLLGGIWQEAKYAVIKQIPEVRKNKQRLSLLYISRFERRSRGTDSAWVQRSVILQEESHAAFTRIAPVTSKRTHALAEHSQWNRLTWVHFWSFPFLVLHPTAEAVCLHPEGSGWKLCYSTWNFSPKLWNVGAALNSTHSQTVVKTTEQKNIRKFKCRSLSWKGGDLRLIFSLRYA